MAAKRYPWGLHRKKGAVVPTVALGLVTLLGFATLAIDVGHFYHARRLMQTGADAGALGGGAELYRNNPSQISASAQEAAAVHGFVNGSSSTVVTVHHPPTSGAYVGNEQYVEVLIQRIVPTFLAKFVGRNSAPIATRAVAGFAAGTTNCIYVMDRTMKGALEMQSNSTLTSDCGVNVNSAHSDALWLQSSARLDARPGTVSVTGGVENEGGFPVQPTPQTAVPPTADPLGYLQPPTYGGCTQNGTLEIQTGTVTLSPGVYCGSSGKPAIIIKNDAHVILNPGIYVLRSGLWTESSSSLEGTGVMLYNTTVVGSTNTYYRFQFGSSSEINLSAPTSGPYAGIAIFADRAATLEADGKPNAVQSSAQVDIGGAIYLPGQPLQLESSAILDVTAPVVAKSLTLQSSSQLLMDNDATGGTALKRLTLVE